MSAGAEEVATELAFPGIGDLPAGDVLVPPIRLDAPPAAMNPTPPRAPDVVLPPGVVMAWSLLVLMAIPLAFAAGLLIGHYVWK